MSEVGALLQCPAHVCQGYRPMLMGWLLLLLAVYLLKAVLQEAWMGLAWETEIDVGPLKEGCQLDRRHEDSWGTGPRLPPAF